MRDCDCSTMARWLQRLLWSLLIGAWLIAGEARAQAPAQPTPDQVKSLLQLLSDPVVKSWIEREFEGRGNRAHRGGLRVRGRRGQRFRLRRAAVGGGPRPSGAGDRRRPARAGGMGRRRRPAAPGGGRLVPGRDGAVARGLRRPRHRPGMAVRARDRRRARALHAGRGTDRGVASQGRGLPSAHRDRRHPVLRGRQRRHVHAVRLAAAVPPAVRELSRGRGGRPAVPVPVPLPVLARSPRVARDPDDRPVGTVRDPLGHDFRRLVRIRPDHDRASARPGRRLAERAAPVLRAWAWPAPDRPAPGLATGRRSTPRRQACLGPPWSLRSGCSGSWAPSP